MSHDNVSRLKVPDVHVELGSLQVSRVESIDEAKPTLSNFISRQESYTIPEGEYTNPFLKTDELQCLSNFLLQNTHTDEGYCTADGSKRYEIITENQRGFTVCGMPVFSSSVLIPWFDPPKLTTLSGAALSGFDMYPIPEGPREWLWDRWYVMMLKDDMDDMGWCYSWKFTSTRWKGTHHIWPGGWCRKRYWIRQQGERIATPDKKVLTFEDVPTTPMEEICNAKADRIRTNIIVARAHDEYYIRELVEKITELQQAYTHVGSLALLKQQLEIVNNGAADRLIEIL